jgi:nucleotide-binding universal stress UspA family protein
MDMTGADSPSVKKILVPIDGSPVSKKAAHFAVHIAKLEKAKVTVMHVIEGVKQGGAIGLQAKYGNVRLVEGFNRVRTQSAEKWVAEIQELADGYGVDVKSEIVPDDGSSEEGMILDYAKKNGVDLIVMGSKGRSRFKRLLVGGVTNAVVNLASCPVLVVR